MQPRNWAAAAPAQGSRKCRTPPRGCAPRPSAPCHRGTNVCRVGHPAPRVGAAEAPSPGLRPVHACACSRGNGQQLRWHDMPWPGAAAGCQAAVQMRMRAHPSASAARRRRTACTPAGGRHAGTPHMLGARACRSCPPQRRRRHATRGPPRPRRPPRRRRPAQRRPRWAPPARAPRGRPGTRRVSRRGAHTGAGAAVCVSGRRATCGSPSAGRRRCAAERLQRRAARGAAPPGGAGAVAGRHVL